VGSFVCTACSGLLRGLNPPHRLKSINMSTFTQDEVEFMKNRGNQLNKMVYLGLYDANAGFSPDPKDTERFKDFLSQKYERKRWYVEPTESMKQKVKSDTEANLDKTTNTTTNNKSSSNLPHSNNITNTIKSPPEPSSTVPTNTARTTRTPSVTSSQPPMLVFDAPVSYTTSPTSLFDDILQSSSSPAANTSPTKSFFSEQPFTQTTTTSSNDANWGAFVETTKHPTTILTNTMSIPTNAFAHPPPEPVDKYAALSELFSSQNTVQDHQPSIFGNTANGSHRTSASGLNNSIFGNAPFSSTPQIQPSSTGITPKFPTQQQQQTNMFPSQPFPQQFTPTSNPFVQQSFGANASNFFGVPPTNQPNPFLNIAQQQPAAQQLPNQFGKPRANSTNPFL
jgi:Arf-GAP domain and FG repeat-containing protein 1